MHFFNNVGIQQKKHLKEIKAQLDTNSVPAFCTNSEYLLGAYSIRNRQFYPRSKATGHFLLCFYEGLKKNPGLTKLMACNKWSFQVYKNQPHSESLLLNTGPPGQRTSL